MTYRIRWAPILACSVVGFANAWYSASTSRSEGDDLGMGFFAVFAIGAVRRWDLRRDRFYLFAAAGAVAALAVMVIRRIGFFDPGFVPAYVLFVLFCLIGSIPRSGSRPRQRAP